MVCQAAGQTRFRALKHEKGIAGCATIIIIKVIVCFQPLQDCQAEYFRQLLKPVTWFYFRHFRSMGEDPLDPSFLLQHRMCQKKMNTGRNYNFQRGCLLGSQPQFWHLQVNPSWEWNMREIMPPRPVGLNYIQMASSSSLPFISKTLPTESAVQKREIVSERSGNEINLLLNSVISPIQSLNHVDGKKKHLISGSSSPLNLPTDDNQVDQADKASAFDGTGDGEMHEDTEEIDALLYADSDDEEDNWFPETSDIKSASNDEEVASSNVPTKRKRLDGDMDPSLIDTASSAWKLHLSESGDCSDESSAVNGGFIQGVGAERDIFSTNGLNKRLKRDRVREAMFVLRQIVPGGKGKGTTALLDKAICYLRSLKAKARR